MAEPLSAERLSLRAERLGALPLINHFIAHLHLERHLETFVPTTDRRVRVPYAKALGVLLRSLLIEREPMYRQHETVSTFAPGAFALDAELAERVGDDAVGRALDRLFDADRAALMTAVVVGAVEAFSVALCELHNDSTSIKFCGQYRSAKGRTLRAKRSAVHHPRLLQGPSSRLKAAAVHPYHQRRRWRASAVPLRGGQL